MIKNLGRKLSMSIIAVWLMIAMSSAIVPLLDGKAPVAMDIPYTWAGAAVLFYYGRNISENVMQAIVMRFLGMRPESTVINNVKS